MKKTAAAATETAPPEVQTPGLDFPVSAGMVTAPFVLTNGYLYQPSNQTDVAEGGRAVYVFTITNAGSYVIHTVVKAPAEESNSFYLNIDNPPEVPTMIWDIEVTTSFAERVVSWREAAWTAVMNLFRSVSISPPASINSSSTAGNPTCN